MDHGRIAPVVGERALGWASRTFDRSAPWLVGALVAFMSAGSVRDWTEPLILVVAVSSGVAAWMGRRRRWPLFVTGAASMLLLALWPAPFVASYYAGTSLRRRKELIAYAAIGSTILIVSFVLPLGLGLDLGGAERAEGLTNQAAILLFMGLGLVAGLWVRARREVLAGLQDRAERLEREQAARSDQARAEERSRIARDMHDVVAHRVSLMVLHAGALEVNAPDQRTAQAAALIRTTGRDALANLRDVLGVLRSNPSSVEWVSGTQGSHAPMTGQSSPDAGAFDAYALTPQPTLDDLDTLLDESRSAGVPVSRRDEGAPGPVPIMVQGTAYRVVQEALTNVHKHAGGAATEVVLTYAAGGLRLVVRNDAPPPGADKALPGGGYGLTGLRERVQLLGGYLVAGPQPDGGFAVTAELPALPQGEHAPKDDSVGERP
ncbi:histidine kinase [Actinopolymorpha sp. B17G11]|uniref:sensor histidine kinase n=1 Tax=Actinopolymorpha sp. B17G11 TaxID=3160861 RepID=UPI0032E43DD1